MEIRKEMLLMQYKVSSQTNPKKLAYAIFNGLRENGGEVVMQAIGAGAVNNAVKGAIIARGLAAPQGGDIKIIPSFVNIDLDNTQKTALQLKVLWN